jgi:hypothetical protein
MPLKTADLRREAKRREITDREAVAWFIENGEEVMLFEEWLRSRDEFKEDGKKNLLHLEPDEDMVYGEYDYDTRTAGALSWRDVYFKKLFEEQWPASPARRKLLAAKAEEQAQRPEQPAEPERKGALSRQIEPPHDRPCWVLQSLGMTQPIKGQMGGFKLVLREYDWAGDAWFRTGEEERPTSFNQACEKADYIGRLPNMGRKRRAFNEENLNLAAPLFEEELSKRAVGRRLKLGRQTVDKLYELWRQRRKQR